MDMVSFVIWLMLWSTTVLLILFFNLLLIFAWAIISHLCQCIVVEQGEPNKQKCCKLNASVYLDYSSIFISSFILLISSLLFWSSILMQSVVDLPIDLPFLPNVYVFFFFQVFFSRVLHSRLVLNQGLLLFRAIFVNLPNIFKWCQVQHSCHLCNVKSSNKPSRDRWI